MVTKRLHCFKFSMFLLLAVLLPFSACGKNNKNTEEYEVRYRLLKSDVPRNLSPAVSGAERDELKAGNGAFTFRLYSVLNTFEEGNFFYSPYGISLALAMTYGGARNETASQIAAALDFTLPQAALHPAFNSLNLDLESRNIDPEGKGYTLNIANAIWGQNEHPFAQPFLDLLAENYGAGLRLVNFLTAAGEARSIINESISHETAGKINELMPPDAITKDTVFVLTNAIYFKAAWSSPFETASTQPGTFYLNDGNQVTAPLMTKEASFNYADTAEYKAVELPYKGGDASMFIVQPKAGFFDAFESTLGYSSYTAIAANFSPTHIRLKLPKFGFSFSSDLQQALSSLGMPIAFTDSADFSGIDGTTNLAINAAIHKAFIKIDEEGTEAAAATGISMGPTSMPPPPIEVLINRPFIFLIRDVSTGTLLFAGRVMNPLL